MISTVITEFREHISLYLDKVEHGETVIITRHGRPVAEVTQPALPGELKSWKRPVLRLKIKGMSISKEILNDRRKSKS